MSRPPRRLIFLPGAGADSAFWRPVAERLPEQWDKTLLGWPGIGRNPPDARVGSFDDLVTHAERSLLRVAGAQGAVDLIAQSMGGAIAIALTLKHPTLVRRLVLSVTAGGMDVEAVGAVDWRPGYREEYPDAASWLYDARPDYSLKLGTISQPTLLLWGDADPISPLPVGEAFRRLLPSSSLVVIAGGTHSLAIDSADEVAGHVAAHLS